MVIFDVPMEDVLGHMMFAVVIVNVGIVLMRKIAVSVTVIIMYARVLLLCFMMWLFVTICAFKIIPLDLD